MPTDVAVRISTTMINGEPYMKMADIALWAATSFESPYESIDPQKFAVMLNQWRNKIIDSKDSIEEGSTLDVGIPGGKDG